MQPAGLSCGLLRLRQLALFQPIRMWLRLIVFCGGGYLYIVTAGLAL